MLKRRGAWAMRAVVLLVVACAAAAVGCDGSAADLAGEPADGGLGEVPSALPETGASFRVIVGRGPQAGQAVAPAQLFATAAAADAICLGELHDDENNHRVQRLVFSELLARGLRTGRKVGLGLEMIQKPFQPPLDDFAAAAIDEAAFLTRSEWQARWGYPFALYRPLLRAAFDARAPALALNAAKELTDKVKSGGLASLTPVERAQLPERIDFDNAAHKIFFAEVSGHGPEVDRIYPVQVVWDETMADTAARWLAAAPSERRQIAILAGRYHCIELGIPMRLAARNVKNVATIWAAVNTPEALAQALAGGHADLIVAYEP